jgi:hypothetical protein
MRTNVRDHAGSPYTRLRRALDHGTVAEALASAGELEHVGLVEALELCLLILDREPKRYGRAALRWHAVFTGRTPDVDLAEGQAVLAALAALQGRRAKPAARRLPSCSTDRALSVRARLSFAGQARGVSKP